MVSYVCNARIRFLDRTDATSPLPARSDERIQRDAIVHVDTILRTLRRYAGPFPPEALEAAVARQEEITPHLLATVEEAASDIGRLAADNTYAFTLLALLPEEPAYRVSTGSRRRLLSRPGGAHCPRGSRDLLWEERHSLRPLQWDVGGRAPRVGERATGIVQRRSGTESGAAGHRFPLQDGRSRWC